MRSKRLAELVPLFREEDPHSFDTHLLHGREGHHADLANFVEAEGFEIVMDPDDNELSFIRRQGRTVGEIVGDVEAKIKMYVQKSR